MVEDAAAAKAELRGAEKKILEIRIAVRGVGEEKLAVEHLRKEFVELHACVFAAESEDMRALHPAHGVHKVEIVLCLVLIAEGSRTNFKSRSGKHKLINGVRHGMRGAIDSQVGIGYRRDVVQAVVDVHETEAELVDQGWREKMRFGGVEKAGAHRRIKREIQGRGADAAGERAAKRFLEVARSKREEAFGIRKEESSSDFVLAVVKFPVPVGRKLIVREFPRVADGEGAGRRIAAGN